MDFVGESLLPALIPQVRSDVCSLRCLFAQVVAPVFAPVFGCFRLAPLSLGVPAVSPRCFRTGRFSLTRTEKFSSPRCPVRFVSLRFPVRTEPESVEERE